MHKTTLFALLLLAGAAQAGERATLIAQAERSRAAAYGSDNTTDTPNSDPTDPVGANHELEQATAPRGTTGPTGTDTPAAHMNDDGTPRSDDPDRKTMPKSEVDPNDRTSNHPSNGPRGTGL
ncbi:MAG: hypothetical protein HY749_22740 [Gammaproteobacteria bacterium]|nr:hypothetical protein [Gammaproteobacteria bacterium]MBI5615747.1 hypothetical protein [Gammaproteobacteria bacterium]